MSKRYPMRQRCSLCGAQKNTKAGKPTMHAKGCPTAREPEAISGLFSGKLLHVFGDISIEQYQG